MKKAEVFLSCSLLNTGDFMYSRYSSTFSFLGGLKFFMVAGKMGGLLSDFRGLSSLEAELCWIVPP